MLFRRSALSFMKKELITSSDMSQFKMEMNESTELPFLACLFLGSKLLTRISLILIRVVESLKGCVGEWAIIPASCALFLVVVLALLCWVKVLIRWAPKVEWLMSIYASIPVVVLWLVCAVGGLIAIHVKDQGVNRLQVELNTFLERHLLKLGVCADVMKIYGHLPNIDSTWVLSIGNWIASWSSVWGITLVVLATGCMILRHHWTFA